MKKKKKKSEVRGVCEIPEPDGGVLQLCGDRTAGLLVVGLIKDLMVTVSVEGG